MDELRAAVRELAAVPGEAAADAVVAGIGGAAPSPELAALITETLELSALHEVRDSRGVTLRWRLVDRLLALGFPHALQVTPEDLDYHRIHGQGGASVPNALTGVMSVVSMLWALGAGALLALIGATTHGPNKWQLALGVGAMFAALLHGLVAFVSSIRVARGGDAPAFRTLGWMMIAGPIIAACAELLEPSGGLVVLILGAPAMLTALLCAVTAAALGARIAPPVAQPAATEPLEDAPAREPQRESAS